MYFVFRKTTLIVQIGAKTVSGRKQALFRTQSVNNKTPQKYNSKKLADAINIFNNGQA